MFLLSAKGPGSHTHCVRINVLTRREGEEAGTFLPGTHEDVTLSWFGTSADDLLDTVAIGRQQAAAGYTLAR